MNILDLAKLGLHSGSHKKIEVECDFNATTKCKKKYIIEYRKAFEWAKNNDGRVICSYCSRRLKFSGRGNPNCKYETVDDNFFANIDTEFKAYMLGWIASDGHIAKNNKIDIQIHPKDIDALLTLQKGFCKELPIIHNKTRELVSYALYSYQASKDIRKWIGDLLPGKKSDKVCFPNQLATDDLKWSFIRGYFDGDGSIRKPNANTGHVSPECVITSTSKKMLEGLSSFIKIKHTLSGINMIFNSNNALDFLGKLYNNSKYSLIRKRSLYEDWCCWVPSLSENFKQVLSFKWKRANDNALAPFKARVSDSGYDLTLIKKINDLPNGVSFYDTGIKIQPEHGWYFDMVARSSLIKLGYLLGNSIGVIDRSFIGTIIVPLVKINKDVPDLELPCRCVQIIPRLAIHMIPIEVDELDDTERSSQGFGSSGVK